MGMSECELFYELDFKVKPFDVVLIVSKADCSAFRIPGQ